jgi:origin recognition complex subunit 3
MLPLNLEKGPKLLPYDLDLLYHYVRQKGIEKVVIAFKDSEACDQGVFSDLISLLR